MSGHAYFGEGANKIKHISFYHNGEMKKIKRVWQYHNGVYRQVWTGASTVNYYDGDTLLGTEEIDENEDVLRPTTIDTSKAGYTLYGWKASPDAKSRIERLVADGEAISLYAYYVPNTLVIASGTINSYGWCIYTAGVWDANYINGSAFASAGRAGYYVGGGEAVASGSFYIALNEYQKASISYRCASGNGEDISYQFDGINRNSGDYTTIVTRSGSHSMYTRGVTSYDSWTSSMVGITNITLSNPIAWT